MQSPITLGSPPGCSVCSPMRKAHGSYMLQLCTLTDSSQRKLQEYNQVIHAKINNTTVIGMEIFTSLWRVGKEGLHGLESYKRQEMKFKSDLNQCLHSPENTTRTFSRNEQQQGRAVRNGTLLNHFWQHFGRNQLNVGTFIPLLTILVEVFGTHKLYLELIAYMFLDISSISKPEVTIPYH